MQFESIQSKSGQILDRYIFKKIWRQSLSSYRKSLNCRERSLRGRKDISRCGHRKTCLCGHKEISLRPHSNLSGRVWGAEATPASLGGSGVRSNETPHSELCEKDALIVSQTLNDSNNATFRHSNSQTFKHSNIQTIKPSNTQALKRSNIPTFGKSNIQTKVVRHCCNVTNTIQQRRWERTVEGTKVQKPHVALCLTGILL